MAIDGLTHKPALFLAAIMIVSNSGATAVSGNQRIVPFIFGEPMKMTTINRQKIKRNEAVEKLLGIEWAPT